MSDLTLQERIGYAIATNAEFSSLSQARSIIDALGLREVYTIAWDGEPSMSGQPRRSGISAEVSYESAVNLLESKYPGSWHDRHPGARIERRVVGSWERT